MDYALQSLDPRLELLERTETATDVHLHVHLRSPSAACPACHQTATRRHSATTRLFMDLPDTKRPVRMTIRLTKWFCDEPACSRKVFTEPVPWLPPRHRRSARLEEQIRLIAFTTSAVQTEKVCRQLGCPISNDAVLALIRRHR
ncbi:transposase family protein [Alkalicoccus luteus]|uniref:Transposase family protein n=1 Tax=Alkalicoccus luteus TaxID=1237094 RepID=A0A969PMM7_9BACI|nr:transposase family protein [Alkalicoccus luteus]NJP36210.1 transposase family protein [Alkalicoccus luteus]